jgi:outer membrane protein OmpU
MINLKKIGLTALAGSLVAISANAVEMSVSGNSEISFVSKDGTGVGGNAVTGNPWGSNTAITFKGSGDVGFGTATITRTLNDGLGAALSTHTKLDMGDMGMLSFDGAGGSLEGLTPNDDTLPTAYEEAWNGVSTSGISGAASNDTLGYSNTFGAFSVSLAKTKSGTAGTGDQGVEGEGLTGSITDVVLTYAADGITVKYGHSENEQISAATTDADTTTQLLMASYSTGPVSVGYQIAEINTGTAGTASTQVDAYSVAFNVNDNLAISYGRYDKELESIAGSTSVTEESTGISAAYTTGAATLRVTSNEAKNAGNVTAVESEHTEISLVLAF